MPHLSGNKYKLSLMMTNSMFKKQAYKHGEILMKHHAPALDNRNFFRTRKIEGVGVIPKSIT
jgi:hypothetical protein